MKDEKEQYSIGMVERDTGIGRDTLRVWERRYGFPEPSRNAKGERMYSENQLRRLQRIRRLLDQGLRPGKLLPLDPVALDALEANMQAQLSRPVNDTVCQLLDAIFAADPQELSRLFHHFYQQQGMQEFILHTVAPLLKATGEDWARGRLQIFQEHLLAEQLRRFLKAQIAHQDITNSLTVMLATLPGESHTLGLLMVEALLAAKGIAAINLGSEVPMDQIQSAVHHFNVDILGITFSASYPYKHIRPHLRELREMINDEVVIWIGGEGAHGLRKLPNGVMKYSSLDKLPS